MAKRKCKQCNRELDLNEENFRSFNGRFKWSCRSCERKQNLARYYRGKKKQKKTKRPRLTDAQQQRKQRVDAMIKKYRRIYSRLKRLGVNPDNHKYNAGDIDEILRKDGFKDVNQTSVNFDIAGIGAIGVLVAV